MQYSFFVISFLVLSLIETTKSKWQVVKGLLKSNEKFIETYQPLAYIYSGYFVMPDDYQMTANFITCASPFTSYIALCKSNPTAKYYEQMLFIAGDIMTFDLIFLGTWNNEAVILNIGQQLTFTFNYISPQIYPIMSSICDNLNVDIKTVNISIPNTIQDNFEFTSSNNDQGSVYMRNIYISRLNQAFKCYPSCLSCTGPQFDQCFSCYYGIPTNNICPLCQSNLFHSQINGCKPICDIYSAYYNNGFCQSFPVYTFLNCQFQNIHSTQLKFWSTIFDFQHIQTSNFEIIQEYQIYGIFKFNYGIQRFINEVQSSIQGVYLFGIKIQIVLFNDIPTNCGIQFYINNQYYGSIYKDATGIQSHKFTIYDNYSLQSYLTYTQCTQYDLITYAYINPYADEFSISIIGNYTDNSAGWGIKSLLITSGYCPQPCLICEVPFQCSKCQINYYIYKDGTCIEACDQPYQKIVGTYCHDYDAETPHSNYLIQEYIDAATDLGQYSQYTLISQNGNNFLKGQDIYFSYFQGYRVFGGQYVWAQAKFQRSHTIINPHHSITIGFYIIYGPSFPLNGKFIYTIQNNSPIEKTRNSYIKIFNDGTRIDKVYEKIIHYTNTLTISWECFGLNNEPITAYCGFYNYYIAVHHCQPFCLECLDQYVCTQFNSTYDSNIVKFQEDCLIHQYYDKYSLQCLDCPQQCLTCKSQLNCLTCKSTYVRTQRSCVCKENQYQQSNQCFDCPLYCSQCISQTHCLKCQQLSNRKILNGQCVCEDGSYLDNLNQNCIPCHSICKTCIGPTANECQTCQNVQFIEKVGQTCQCQQGTFFFNGLKKCQQCHESCLTCFGGTKNDCLLCNSNQNRILKGLQCKCQPGFQEVNNVCISCPSIENSLLKQCYKKCSGTLLIWHNSNCNSCDSGFTMVLGECQPICGDTQIVGFEQCEDNNNVLDDLCYNCQFQCPSYCINCDSTTILPCDSICGDGIISGNEQCDDGNFIAYDGCFNCQYQCQKQCTKCIKGECFECATLGWEINPNVIPFECQEICGDRIIVGNEYCDHGVGIYQNDCVNCKFECKGACSSCDYINRKCIDCELIGFKPLAYFCINICGDGLVVSHPYGFSEECDDGNTFNNDGCNSNCQFECYQGSKCKICRYGNCLECVTGYNLVDDLCVVNQDPSCNDNFILPYKGCQNFKPMCQTSCEQCDMFGKGCLNCKTGYKIIDYLCYSICGDNIVTIDEQCDDGNILYGDGCHQCQFSCSHTCIDCIKGRCQECIDGFELYLYQCKPISLQLNNCQLLCDSNCLICQCGICQVCSNGYYLSQNNEFCIQQSTFLSQFIDYCKIQIDYTCLVCQDLAYLDQFKQICVIMSNSCVKNCQLCIEDYCIQCQSGYYGTKCLPQLGEGIIIGEDICYSSGTQILNDNFECNHNCDKNCLNCYNGRCYLCQNRSYLFNNQCIQEHFLEITYVKDGYAQCGDSILGMNEQCDDGNNYIFDGCYDCKYQCDQFCEQCIFGICTSCIQGLILNSNNICEPLCGDNLVIPYSNEQCDDINNSNCVNCHYQCQQYCVDCNLLQCFQCQIGFQVNMNECQPFCGDGIVINNFENCDDGNDIQFDGCYNCEFQCTQYCSICNEGICSECIENYQLVDNSCNQISNNEEQENPNDNGNTDENSNIDESGNTDENGNTTNDNIDEQNDENNKYPNDNDKGSADTQNSKNNTNSNGKSDSTNNSINNNKTNSNNPNINQGLLEQKNEPILFEMACRNNECVFSQKPRMLLVYINQIFSQQTIHIKFDQEVKLDQTTQINNQMFTITIANLNTQDYKIIVESLKDISSDLQFIEYQVIIDIFVQLESKPNLIVQLDQEITNQNNQTISNNNQTILLEIPKILSQKNKQTSITMQKSNKGFIIGALSIASISLLSGESSIFIETFNVLQYQSYFKFINVDYPENLFLYFEAQDMLSVQSYINFLQIDDFLKFITGYQNQTQIQLVGKFELYNIEIDLLTNIFPQIFQCFLMVAFFACAGKLFQLYLKLRAYKNFLQILNSTKSKILTPILSSILMISYNIKLFIKMRYFSSQNSIRQLIQLNAWDLIFKIFLSIQNHPINNFRNVISNLISFLILITFINFILKSIQSQLKNKNIKKKSDIQFITLDMVRTSIFHFVLVFFQKQQMLQSLLIFIINLSQCLVIFKYKQCSKAEKYVSLIIEGILSIFTLTLICYTKTAEMYLSPQNIITLGFIHMYLLLSTLLIVFIKQLIPQVLKISQLKCKNNQEKRASNLLFF